MLDDRKSKQHGRIMNRFHIMNYFHVVSKRRACLKTTRGDVFEGKAGWRGATRENIPGGSSTEEQRSQTVFPSKTLRAAGLLAVVGVGSVLAARCGNAPARVETPSPPWPQPKSLAAAPLVVFKQALKRLVPCDGSGLMRSCKIQSSSRSMCPRRTPRCRWRRNWPR
jgi:hypothetical protein